MTILFFARLFYPHIGGVEKHVLEVGKLLVERGHEVIVIAQQHEKSLKLKEKYQKIQIYRIPITRPESFKKIDIWIWLFKNRRIMQRADIIHCHDVFFWYLPFRFLYPKKKVFTTFHGYESYPISAKAFLVRKISEKLSFGNICIGEFIEKWYRTKATVVSYGATVIPLEKKVQNQHTAVFIGRLDEQTGILTYIQAVKILKKTVPDFKLTVVGDGKFRQNISSDVELTGTVEKPIVYLLRTRFAFVSRYLSILEAFGCKRLVFAVYDNPIKEDYLRMAPFAKYMVIAHSADEIVGKVIYYLHHPQEEKKLVENAYEWVKDKTWESVVWSYEKLWMIKEK